MMDMTQVLKILIPAVLFALLAPLAGGLLAGFDRILSARIQKRVGPPLLQPFYDVLKLLGKENVIVNRSQNIYVICFLVFTVFTGALFFAGQDILLTVFSSTLAGVFLVLAGYSTYSPYSYIGSERELISMMADEPMVVLMAVGMYMVTRSFRVSDILHYGSPVLPLLPGVFLGYVFILTIKFRKSPFDLSSSPHAHQEVVSGIKTEFSGKSLALIEVAHWYETVFLLATVYLFFASSPVVGVLLALAAFVLEILIDNSAARVKWPWLLNSAWFVALTFGAVNILVLYVVDHF